MKRTMRMVTSAAVTATVLFAGFTSPVAGSVPHVAADRQSYDMNDFFPMAIGNSWQWADTERVGDFKQLNIVDQMEMKGYVVWVAETRESVRSELQTPGVTYFVVHEDGLFATRFLDTLMDWSHDTDDTAMLQRWTHRKIAAGTHTFIGGGIAQAYTVDMAGGVPAMRIHDASGQTTYQRYAFGIGPVARGGHFELQRATVGGVEYIM